MADEDGFSLLGELAGELVDGLAHSDQSIDDGSGSAVPGSSFSPDSLEPWHPRQAIVRAERSEAPLADEARRIAHDLMIEAGLMAPTSTWRLRNGPDEVALRTGSPTDIGRNDSRGASFLVNHPVVSRLQCRVELRGDGPTVMNLGSVNPAFIRRNGLDSPVGVDPVALNDGDEVLIGDDVLLFTVHEVTL